MWSTIVFFSLLASARAVPAHFDVPSLTSVRLPALPAVTDLRSSPGPLSDLSARFAIPSESVKTGGLQVTGIDFAWFFRNSVV